MKIAESWLRDWVDPKFDTEELGHQLTMLGHEVDAIAIEGDGIDDVMIAEVLEVKRHPDADRLSVCRVSDGNGDAIDVVCGAPNVRAGMKTPLAKPGTTLPNGVKLRKSKIRGVVSNGMLCSTAELGLGEDADGIMDLPADAPTGTALVEYLGLPDAVIDLDLTPNRGDCFSILGIARDLAGLTGDPLKAPDLEPPVATIEDVHPVELVLPEGCPRFAGRVVRGIDMSAHSPLWMVERLRRAGLRAIHPVVDVTNYVMLELGQPLHAYDLNKLDGPIRPRLAKKGEKVVLLDEKEVEVNEDTLVISDDSGVIGLAGIMGGLSTAVTDDTVDVFFEGAFWPPAFMAGRARAYGMHTDASLRFERGVDPEGQGRAVDRAVQLLVDIAGGDAGLLDVQSATAHLPARESIRLRRDRITHLLGMQIADDVVERILTGLEIGISPAEDGWDAVAPSHRFDLSLEVDLIEEIARIHGYDEIPEATEVVGTPLEVVTESTIDLDRVAATLVARDYQEAVTYSFVDASANEKLTGVQPELILANPISSEMSAMRTSLWPGLVEATARNASRQQDRVRLFEVGVSFHGSLGDHNEVVRIAGISYGDAVPEQWSARSRTVDFFDIKGDVEALLQLAVDEGTVRFEPLQHGALQPGQSATILRDGEGIGILGKLHPQVAKAFNLKRDVFVFELDAAAALRSAAPVAKEISKYPAIRRDIAVIVDDKVSADELVRAASNAAPDLIQSVRIFDVYKGSGIEAGRKSIALGLILQETSRTLTDDDADAAMAAAIRKLQGDFGAELRD
ncbi:MAG: phenylalanine--tRNA ligase subunit beta [Woeseiaceae bacterium]|nr:phenylalanine--tRNA ligase subunit beta [Woeseiaceae bacterium]